MRLAKRLRNWQNWDLRGSPHSTLCHQLKPRTFKLLCYLKTYICNFSYGKYQTTHKSGMNGIINTHVPKPKFEQSSAHANLASRGALPNSSTQPYILDYSHADFGLQYT